MINLKWFSESKRFSHFLTQIIFFNGGPPLTLHYRLFCLLFYYVIIRIVRLLSKHSRYLGLSSTAYDPTMSNTANTPYRTRCSESDVLAPHQRELCFKSQNILDVVSQGASMGIKECKHQFRNRRWNCTTFNNTSVFGNILNISKEN